MNTEENNFNQQPDIKNLEPESNNIPEPQNNEEQNDLLKELTDQSNSNRETYTYYSPANEIETQKKRNKLRLVLEIVGGIVLLFALFSSGGKVSKEKYDSLNSKYQEQTENLELVTSDFENIKTEYEDYKSKMSKFDSLSDEQIDALIAEAEKITAEKKAAEEQAAAEEEARKQAEASATMEQKNALEKGKQYLRTLPFSYTGLFDQLKYEGYSDEAATYAVDNCGADWNNQAAKKAQQYLDTMSFSRSGLLNQLLYEGFTAEQAEYGVTSVGY